MSWLFNPGCSCCCFGCQDFVPQTLPTRGCNFQVDAGNWSLLGYALCPNGIIFNQMSRPKKKPADGLISVRVGVVTEGYTPSFYGGNAPNYFVAIYDDETSDNNYFAYFKYSSIDINGHLNNDGFFGIYKGTPPDLSTPLRVVYNLLIPPGQVQEQELGVGGSLCYDKNGVLGASWQLFYGQTLTVPISSPPGNIAAFGTVEPFTSTLYFTSQFVDGTSGGKCPKCFYTSCSCNQCLNGEVPCYFQVTFGGIKSKYCMTGACDFFNQAFLVPMHGPFSSQVVCYGSIPEVVAPSCDFSVAIVLSFIVTGPTSVRIGCEMNFNSSDPTLSGSLIFYKDYSLPVKCFAIDDDFIFQNQGGFICDSSEATCHVKALL